MPHQKAQSVGVLNVREHPMETPELAREVNRVMRLVTDHIDTLYGFRGRIPLHNEVDLQGNELRNVAESSQVQNAATVAQIKRLEESVTELQRLVVALQRQTVVATQLSGTAPQQVDAGDIAVVGTEPLAAHGDHAHPVNTAAIGDITSLGVKSAGSVQTLPRANHVHDVSIVGTGVLPAAGAAQNGLAVIEDAGAGVINFVIYGANTRYRLTGVAF